MGDKSIFVAFLFFFFFLPANTPLTIMIASNGLNLPYVCLNKSSQAKMQRETIKCGPKLGENALKIGNKEQSQSCH